MSRILLTGSTGLIGSQVARALKKNYKDADVFCLVRNPQHPVVSALKESGCNIVEGDVAVGNSIGEAFSSTAPDVVINCAGVLRALDKSRYYAVNTEAVAKIAALARASGAKVVHISSLAAYGPSVPSRPRRLVSISSDGKDTPSPVSDYGRSKLGGNIALINSGARYTIVVPSAVYGPRDKDMFVFFKLASWGISIATSRRRTIHLSYIEDVVRVISGCAFDKNTDGKTYYAACNEEYDWENMLQVIGKIAGRKKMFKVLLPEVAISASAFVSEKITELLTNKPALFNRDKAREMLAPAWIAQGSDITEKELGIKFTNFADGALKTYNWYKQNHWL